MADEGRRTRSTRSKAVTTPPPAPRATRRTRKQTNDEEQPCDDTEPTVIDGVQGIQEEQEDAHETSDGVMDGSEPFENAAQNEDNGSSNFGYDDNLTYEQQSNEKEEETNNGLERGEQEKFIADLAEENANSFPSGCDDNSIDKNPEVVASETESNQAEIQGFMDGDYEMIDETDERSIDKTENTFAQSDDTKPGDPDATDLDAENISEDELPAPDKPKVQDAEEVSDEELPGPKLAELPADTEVVSEDELPNPKKEGKRKLDDYDPSEPTDDAPEKRTKTDIEESEKPKYSLPDLEKYWKPVKADPEDFNGWTQLLAYVDSENDVEAARDAFDCFLSRYSYCYGYWRKYADYEKKKGSAEKCDEVFERGLKAIPLSIDLWIHYLSHVKQKHQSDPDFIRAQFMRALDACGLEFRSDKVWQAFINWETENGNVQNVVGIYDRLLTTPTQGYKTHMENFRELVNNNPVQKLLPTEEIQKLRDAYRMHTALQKEDPDDQFPPGEDEPADHVRNEEEADGIRKIIISNRRRANKTTVEMINKRWSFEEGIKRPYFHVKPLENIQLKNWREYLDFEIEQGDKKRILVLFERCLIACALYEEFWSKLIRYLDSNKEDTEYDAKARDVYERACKIHHPDKPNLHLMWSAFEEGQGNITRAAEILENLDRKCPDLLQVAYRRINLQRRLGDYTKCIALYEHHISSAKNNTIMASLAIKYARFLNKFQHDIDGAMKVLKTALEKDPLNTRIALQIVDLALQRQQVNEKEVLDIINIFMAQEKLEFDQKLLFAQRKVEFLEDFGINFQELQDAKRELQVIVEKAKELKKKQQSEEDPKAKKKREQSSSSSSYNGANSTGSAYNYNQNYYAQYPYSGGSYDYNQWSGYQQSTYGNSAYGSQQQQWSGYGGSY